MDIKPVYLFYGEDRFQLETDIGRFRRYFEGEGVAAEVFDGSKVSLSEIIAAAEDVPLFGGGRFIVVRRAPWFSAKKKPKKDSGSGPETDYNDTSSGAELLLEYLDKVNPDTCLVFVADTVDKRMKTVKAAASVGKVREYKLRRDSELPGFIRDYLSRYKVSISPAALDTFKVLTGNDTGVIQNELDKLIFGLQNSRRIEEKDVLALTSATAEATSFLLADKIGERNSQEVRNCLHSMAASAKSGEYPMLFGFLINHFRLMIRYKEKALLGKRADTISNETKTNPYRGKKIFEGVKQYALDELYDAYALLLECDFKVKTGKWGWEDGLTVTLTKIVGTGKKRKNSKSE